MDKALFFFGSKQSWVFPTTPEQEAEAKEQPGRCVCALLRYKCIMVMQSSCCSF
jgi:hypothetical protein